MVQLKGSILGVLVAGLIFGDGLFNRGRYFGGRLARYMPMPIVPQRLALGMAVLGVVMAVVNWLVATYLSTDLWLYYTSFGDFILTVTLVFSVMRYAQRREGEVD